MGKEDCTRIANDAHIQFDAAIDIFYNSHSEFEENESNVAAANQLKLFCPKPLVHKKQQTPEVPLGKKCNYNSHEQAGNIPLGTTTCTWISLYISQHGDKTW